MSQIEWTPQGPVIELSELSCWHLLKEASFGRLAVTVDGRPDVFPIDFVVEERTILFRTAEGTKLRALEADPHVALESDERSAEAAWSVVLIGEAAPDRRERDPIRAARSPLPEWIPIADHTYVRITPTSVRGRSFQRHLTKAGRPTA
ncbi:pyridoxamine 5'-phosphate oxidase family protein [Rathayibacter oskolensis]|uniref:pyridoxamine 5'-phosphate oxidase family protein n=1 Tax=Rathayibacter TaxID=33886 RepID=UPI0013161D60|nr:MULTISPECIES: pyridoxamine 5'-phosphate oxidase family protein [Rathayibacter]QHC68115.1 pyridoxamine 5'-phosphate oxidase family protein [Rathayibacter sp. VKM Ac-2759]WKK72571.1 pyridoxamine 5'-phosphate oxidase family protein [Rathayibacter oskolensis]